MSEVFNVQINYEKLREIILNYFKENQNLELGFLSIDILKRNLRDDESTKYFSLKHELGEAKFDISKEDIQIIIKSYLASKNCELLDIKYDDEVSFSYKQNQNINQDNIEKVNLNLTYKGSVGYELLRQLVFDYYMNVKGLKINSTSIQILRDKLKGNNTPKFFILNNEFGESRFDVSKEDIIKLFKAYLAGKNCELTEINFEDEVIFKFKERTNLTMSNADDFFTIDQNSSLEDVNPDFGEAGSIKLK
jgi:hypothetical protein